MAEMDYREIPDTLRPAHEPSTRERLLGCLLGGAVGDALGAPIEFLSLSEIRRRFGSRGLRDFGQAYGRVGAITDDTQMTMFTAEGLIRASNCQEDQGSVDTAVVLHRAYLRWLHTLGEPLPTSPDPLPLGGWLVEVGALHAARSPGNTCLSALRSGRMGRRNETINHSKGCGGIMRVAPVGFAPISADSFSLGCDSAAITHGHPTGYLAAGFFAMLIELLQHGTPLRKAIAASSERLRQEPSHEECLVAVERALSLAGDSTPTAEAIEELGQGWIAEEALSIALFCSLVSWTFENAVLLAVNHGGDSDSTGSLTGNIMGTLLGINAIPQRWVAQVELRAELERLGLDLYERFYGAAAPDHGRYPPW